MFDRLLAARPRTPKPTHLLLAFTCLGSLPAMASETLCPLPIGINASIGAAKEAIAAKEAGTPKADLLKKITQGPDNPVGQLLKDIVNEVYDHPTLRPEVYAAYRFEHCFVSQQHPTEVASIQFAEAYPLLHKCELVTPEGARPPCAMKVVHQLTGVPE